MKIIKKKIVKAVITLLASCGITATFTACYGTPIAYPEEDDDYLQLHEDFSSESEDAISKLDFNIEE